MSNNLQTPQSIKPRYNSISNDSGVTVRIELPNVKKGDVTIHTEKQQLKVQAKRSDSTPESWNLLNEVRRPSTYALTLNAHRDLDLTSIKATFNNGVLKLEITKHQESLPLQINITD